MEYKMEQQELRALIEQMLEKMNFRQLRYIYIFTQQLLNHPNGEERD
jgi:hypothetical protein